VAGNDQIWKSEQPREHVVAKNQPRTIFEENLFVVFVHTEAEVTGLAARRQLITRPTLISSSVKLLGESPYRPVAMVTEYPSLRRACAIAWGGSGRCYARVITRMRIR